MTLGSAAASPVQSRGVCGAGLSGRSFFFHKCEVFAASVCFVVSNRQNVSRQAGRQAGRNAGRRIAVARGQVPFVFPRFRFVCLAHSLAVSLLSVNQFACVVRECVVCKPCHVARK